MKVEKTKRELTKSNYVEMCSLFCFICRCAQRHSRSNKFAACVLTELRGTFFFNVRVLSYIYFYIYTLLLGINGVALSENKLRDNASHELYVVGTVSKTVQRPINWWERIVHFYCAVSFTSYVSGTESKTIQHPVITYGIKLSISFLPWGHPAIFDAEDKLL